MSIKYFIQTISAKLKQNNEKTETPNKTGQQQLKIKLKKAFIVSYETFLNNKL